MTLVLLSGLALGRTIFLNQAIDHQLDQGVSAAVWDIVIRYLKTDLRWTLLIAVLVGIGCWLAGPARYAVAIRSGVARGWHWVGAQLGSLRAGTGRAAAGSAGTRRTAGWIGEHVNGLRVLGIAIAALVLLFGGNLTGWSLLVILVVLVVYLALVQLILSWAHRVGSAATPASPSTP
jgi:hypothetical protein